jgi:hypothetical protein
LVGLLAIAGLSACGDKVTVPPPTSNAPDLTVHSVTVSPASVNMQVGQTVTLAASVDAGAGVTVRTVTWTSSNTAVVTVDGTGIVTAKGPGTATVLAAATADPNVKGASAITVGGGGTPSISIASTNTTVCGAAGCNSVPANLSNFGTGTGIGFTGQLDVTANVDANGNTLKNVTGTLTCGTTKQTVTQNLSVAPAAGADENAAPVALTFQTAAFDPTTGVPQLFNTGAFNVKNQATPPCSLQVSVTPASGPAVNASALSVTLNNLDVAIVNTTKSGSSASDADGLPWVSGDITVSVLPVLYSQRTASSLLVTLPGANGANQTVAATATGATAVKWANDANATNNVAQKTLNSVDANGFPAGIHPTVTVIDAAGNTALLGQGNPTSQSDLRIDNQSPQPPLTFQIPSLQGQWVNGTYTFSSLSSTAPAATEVKYVACGDGTAPAAASPQNPCSAQAGVSRATTNSPIAAAGQNPNSTLNVFAFDVTTGASVPGALTNGTSTSSTTCNAASTANGWIDVTSNAGALTEGPTNTRYIVRAVEKDKLGNIRCSDLATTTNTINNNGAGVFVRATIGSDKTPPTVPNGRLANTNEDPTAANDQATFGVAQPLLNFAFSAVDNLSGFSAQPVNTKLTRFDQTSSAKCIIGSGNSCNPVARAISPVVVDANGNVPPASSGIDGYYTYTASVQDLATNVTSLPSRTVLVDRAVPVMGGIQVPATISGGQAVNFATSATDNLDLISSDFTLTYPITPANAAPAQLAIRAAGPSLGVAFDNTLTTAASFSYTVPAFIRTLAVTSAANAPTAAGTAVRPNLVTGRVYDGANNQSVASSGAITAANIPIPATGTGAQTDFSLPQPNTAVFQTFQVSNAAASICNVPAGTNCASSTSPTTVNLTATATGTEGAGPPAFQFINPFPAGLSFYYFNPATGEWTLIGTVAAPSVSDNVGATIRTFTWTFASWDPPSALGTAGAVNIVAVGVNSLGDALGTANNANITLIP